VAVVNANATLNVSGGGIDGNSASEQGGGVYVYDGSATLNETQVVSNSAKNGGGVGVWGGSATLNGTQVLGNSADNGGGIDLFGNGTIVAADGCIVFNSDVAVDGALTAMDNWWGTPDGPGGMGPGSGDTVGAGVNYDNFKIEAPPGCPSRPFFDPEITVAPTTLDFGIRDVHAGATVSQTVTITNEGNADLHISAVITTGDAAEFNLFGNSAITVMEGGVHTIEVSFDPSSGGMKVVTLTIESDDRDEAAVTVVLSGTGWAQPGYGSDPAPGSSIEVGIEVGTVSVGNTVYSRLAISETGNMTLTVTPTLSGADEADFGFTPSTLTILNGEAAQDLIISCTPMAVRTFVATLTVAHNAPDSPAVYSLSCIGEEDYIYLPLVLRSE